MAINREQYERIGVLLSDIGGVRDVLKWTTVSVRSHDFVGGKGVEVLVPMHFVEEALCEYKDAMVAELKSLGFEDDSIV